MAQRGRPKKPDAEKKRHNVTVAFDDSLKVALDAAASASGRSLSGEIQYRLERYEMMSRSYAVATKRSSTQKILIGIGSLDDEISDADLAKITTDPPDLLDEHELREAAFIAALSNYTDLWFSEKLRSKRISEIDFKDATYGVASDLFRQLNLPDRALLEHHRFMHEHYTALADDLNDDRFRHLAELEAKLVAKLESVVDEPKPTRKSSTTKKKKK